MSTHQILLAEIEAFLVRHGMAPTTFGLEVCNDAKLVSDLRAGRDMKLSMVDRVRAFMADRDGVPGPLGLPTLNSTAAPQAAA